MEFHIKERSVIAGLAAIVLKGKRVAITIGKTIYLTGVNKQEFLSDPAWFAHEMVHIAQFKKYGFIKFLYLYLKESLIKGYYKNKFEVEAREAEKENRM
jgi:hypothetical protein